MSSKKNEPPHKAGQTFIFDFGKNVGGPKSADADEPFSIPSFLKTGPAAEAHRKQSAPSSGRPVLFDEDFARIAQTAKPQLRDPAAARAPEPAPEPAPASTPEKAEVHIGTPSLAKAEASDIRISSEADKPAAPRPVAHKAEAPEAPKPDVAVEEAAQPPRLAAQEKPAAIAPPDNEKREPRWSGARSPSEERYVPEVPSPLSPRESDETRFYPSNYRRDEKETPETRWRRAEPADSKRIMPEAPGFHARPKVRLEESETNFRASRPSWADERKREPLWSSPRNADRQWPKDDDWRRLDIPSTDDDEDAFVPPTAPRERRTAPYVTWLLLFVAVAAGGYGYFQSKRGPSPADASQTAMLTPDENPEAIIPSPAPSLPPDGMRAAVPDQEPVHTVPVPPATASKSAPQKSASTAPASPTQAELSRTVERRKVMAESRSQRAEENTTPVTLAPGPHSLTAPSSYEATRGGAVLSGLASEVQEKLTLLGYPSVPRTGVLDAATRQAIRLFQTNSGLPATGEVDSQTLDRLNSVPEARMRLVKGPDALTAP